MYLLEKKNFCHLEGHRRKGAGSVVGSEFWSDPSQNVRDPEHCRAGFWPSHTFTDPELPSREKELQDFYGLWIFSLKTWSSKRRFSLITHFERDFPIFVHKWTSCASDLRTGCFWKKRENAFYEIFTGRAREVGVQNVRLHKDRHHRWVITIYLFIFFHPSLLLLFWIQDPGWLKIRIRDLG